MTSRIIIQIEPFEDDSMTVKLYRAPRPYPGAEVVRTFHCDPKDMPDTPEDCGRLLREKLLEHDAIRRAFEDALLAAHGDMVPIYFYVVPQEAEMVWWEALCDDKGNFLALDRRWPVGRMTSRVTDVMPATARSYKPPLRMMAVLSALPYSAQEEWRELYGAITSARDRGLEIEVLAIISEPRLHPEIMDQKDPNLRVEYIPPSGLAVQQRIAEFNPMILHFFCHGSTTYGAPRIELATTLDWDARHPTHGSINLTVDQLLGVSTIRDVWLVTLNCCRGGEASDNVHSLVQSLVANGTPAAVGMKETVDVPDANAFCGAFYKAVFDGIRAAVESSRNSGREEELEWASALHDPRVILRERHQDPGSRQWTLPVLYVQPDRFLVREPSTNSQLDDRELQVTKIAADTIAGLLRTLPPDDQGLRENVEQLVRTQQADLWPEPEGRPG